MVILFCASVKCWQKLLKNCHKSIMLRRDGEGERKDRSTVVGRQRDAGEDHASRSRIRAGGFAGAADGAFGRESEQGVAGGGPARGSRPLGRGRAGRFGRRAAGGVSPGRRGGELFGGSRSEVALEVVQLVEAGLLVEDGLGDSEGGRRSSLSRVPRGAGLVAAVDLGATSANVAVTTVGGEVIGRTGEPADIREGPNQVLGRAVELLSGLQDEQGADAHEVIAVGVGLPGPVEYATGRPTVPPLMPGWDSYPIHEAFAGWYGAPGPGRHR